MDNNTQACGTEKKCPVSCLMKLVGKAIPVAIFIGCYEYLVHMKWLMDLYNTTPNLWRTPEEMKAASGGGLCFARLAVMSLAIAALYCKTKKKPCYCGCANCTCCAATKKCPIAHGLCFGVALGLFWGTLMASSYFWMPISAELGEKWFLAGLGEGIGAGLVLGIVCKICKKMCNKGGACGTGTTGGSCGTKAA